MPSSSSRLLVVNLDTKTVEVSGARVHVTVKEYEMLELLLLRKGTMLTMRPRERQGQVTTSLAAGGCGLAVDRAS